MNAQQWDSAINVALDLVDELNYSDTAEERASSFVAYLAGEVKHDDVELSQELLSVLHPSTQDAAA